jgi:hypothetical protein
MTRRTKEKKLTEIVMVKVSEKLKLDIQEKARVSNMSQSEFIRSCVGAVVTAFDEVGGDIYHEGCRIVIPYGVVSPRRQKAINAKLKAYMESLGLLEPALEEEEETYEDLF